MNRKTISVRIELVEQASVTEELKQCKGKQKTIRLDTFQVVGKLESITLSKRLVAHPRGEARFHSSKVLPVGREGIPRLWRDRP